MGNDRSRMPRKPCYWTRKLELELVRFVRDRDYIWKPVGNTNNVIMKKYKAYAEFAAKLGPGFSARSVRDRWVNIRSTFNHNMRRVRKSRSALQGEEYTPCWPLWQPLQYLAGSEHQTHSLSFEKELNSVPVKEEFSIDMDPLKLLKANAQSRIENNLSEEPLPEDFLPLRQRGQRTGRPKNNMCSKTKNAECKAIVEDLTHAMKPLLSSCETESQDYWFLGKHVTERLNSMRAIDAENASHEIVDILKEFGTSSTLTKPCVAGKLK